MTREEAIDLNKNLRMYMRLSDKYQPCKFLEENYIALDMAIKALEQKPCDDAISREMTLKECHDIIVDGERYSVIQEETLLGLPSVTPAEKMGHWIDADGDNAICGCCNRLNHLYGDYCKHCGAKMVEPQASLTSCSTCILDNTDACTRGAGRAVDDDACEDYLASQTGAERSDKE